MRILAGVHARDESFDGETRRLVNEAMDATFDTLEDVLFVGDEKTGEFDFADGARDKLIAEYTRQLKARGLELDQEALERSADGALNGIRRERAAIIRANRLIRLARQLFDAGAETEGFEPTAEQEAMMRLFVKEAHDLNQARRVKAGGFDARMSKGMEDTLEWCEKHLARLARERGFYAEAAREYDRAARRAARDAEPDPEPAERKCASCGKKPARVDDLCKRCAHAAGTLPHGKIGEG